jgi:DNA-binding CsgD family transcriptional regulator
MKPSFRPAWEFLRTASSCKTLDDLQSRLAAALYALEFDQFSCAIARGPRGKPVEPRVLFGQANREWDEHYLSQGYLAHDPCVRQLFVSPLKYFAWSDIPLEGLTGIARDMREDAGEHGLRNGFVVPVPGDDGELYGVRMMTPEPSFDPDARNLLNVMATLYCVIGVERLSTVVPESRLDSPLSPRETQCLAWVAEGKSDWDISEILQISQWTVHEHIERAKSKIGVRSRTKAAVVAAGSGWLPGNPPR